MTSLNTSLRNIVWRRHTSKINLSKSDISPDRLYHSRSRFSKKLTVSIGVSLSGKTDVFSLIRRKQKLTRTVTLICWRLPYTTAWMSSTLSERWLWILARQYSVTPCKVMQQFLRQNIPDFIAAVADEWASYSPHLNPLYYCICDILQDLVYEGRQLPFENLQDFKEAVKSKCKEVTIETVRKFIAQWNKTLAIANRSRVSCAHNTSRASMITPWSLNLN